MTSSDIVQAGTKGGKVKSLTFLRTVLRSAPGARSSRQFFRALREVVGRPYHFDAAFDQLFAEHKDPWNFEGTNEQARMNGAYRMLVSATGGELGHVLEIGCAEGHFTTRLKSAKSLIAVDVSQVAIARARERCNFPVDFRYWDLLVDSPIGCFDLVTAMCVLEYLRRPSDFRSARQKLVDSLCEEGLLLLSHARQSEVSENSWWSKFLLRDGKWINRFIAKHPMLEIVDFEIGDTYLNCLFRKTAKRNLR